MHRKYLASLFILSFAIVFVCGCKKQAPPPAPAAAADSTPPPASDSVPTPDSAAAPAHDTDIATKVCVHNLEVIAAGKRVWAQQYQKGPDDVPTMDDLAVFVRHTPSCPRGGTYTIGKVGELPSCSIAEHQAEFLKKLQAGSDPAP
jgi:hypothetical protein